jgi:hypothetical protein
MPEDDGENSCCGAAPERVASTGCFGADSGKSLFDVAVAPPSGPPSGSLSALRSGSAHPITAATGPGLEGLQF